jgi:hypothetical protein
VDRCRPYLIVLLGDRYGWVPPADRMAVAATEVGFAEDIAGRSVTELEIVFGALSNPGAASAHLVLLPQAAAVCVNAARGRGHVLRRLRPE